jgi:site-specific DNA recombinase
MDPRNALSPARSGKSRALSLLGGRIYPYYVTCEAITDGYHTYPITNVQAADVARSAGPHPEAAGRAGGGCSYLEAGRRGRDHRARRPVLLADFATVWSELFPAEQARIVQLLVERVDVQEDALDVRIRAEGLASLVAELRQHDERRAA